MENETHHFCTQPWEALSGDPLPWLLDSCGPGVRWRTLLEVYERPRDAPAVVRARGGASGSEPVASLLAGLDPDGSWPYVPSTWKRYSGTGWRLIAAVQLGADTSDPRLRAAADRLLHSESGEGGFEVSKEAGPAACLTARCLAALAALGQGRDPRFEEALAWLSEAPAGPGGIGWACPVPNHQRHTGGCALTAVAVLSMLLELGGRQRRALKSRAALAVERVIASGCRMGAYRDLGHLNLMRTDQAEMLSVLARSGVAFSQRLRPALLVLQNRQMQGGRWPSTVAVPGSLPLGRSPVEHSASPWVTLRAAVAVMGFAVAARLPRAYPRRPDAS